jgi:hypothetical protein
LYRRYNAHPPERSLMDHLRNVIRSEITRKWALRREPKIKPIMGPDFFMYHLYFLWVRDTSAFRIGLDRIDDACLRMFYMWTGCRKHELIYAKPTDLTAKVKEYDEESGAYTDVECSTDKYIKPRVKRCWVCDRVAKPFFTTKLNKRALKVWWKKEWLHKPVFRKTELRKSVEKKLEMEIRPATQRDALFREGFKEKEVHREMLKFGDGSDLWEKFGTAQDRHGAAREVGTVLSTTRVCRMRR